MSIQHDRAPVEHPSWCTADEGCSAGQRGGYHTGPYEVLPRLASGPGATSYVIDVTGTSEPMVTVEDWRHHTRMPVEIEMTVADAVELHAALGRVLADLEAAVPSGHGPDREP